MGAYIQQAWWDLKEGSNCLPNKPYSINRGEISETTQVALDKNQD